MPSPESMIAALRRLNRNITATEKPHPEDLPAVAADWCDLLSDLDDADLAAAVRAWLNGPAPFWPTPGQLRDAWLGATGDRPLTEQDRRGVERRARTWAEALWSGPVLEAARNCRNPPAAYDADPWVEAAVQRGLEALATAEGRGLQAVGRASDRDLPRLRQQFVFEVAGRLEELVAERQGHRPERAALCAPRVPEVPMIAGPVATESSPWPPGKAPMDDPAIAAWNAENRRRFAEGRPLVDRQYNEYQGPARRQPAQAPPLKTTRPVHFPAYYVGIDWCSEADVGQPIPPGWVPPPYRDLSTGKGR